MLESSTTMRDTINRASVDNFIQTAKLDHVVWKSENLCGNFSTARHIQQRIFQITRKCSLGEWYYQGLGAETMQGNSAFQRLEETS